MIVAVLSVVATAHLLDLVNDRCESRILSLANLDGRLPDVPKVALPSMIAACQAIGKDVSASECEALFERVRAIRQSSDGPSHFAKLICKDASPHRRQLEPMTIAALAALAGKVISVAGAAKTVYDLSSGSADDSESNAEAGWRLYWFCDDERACGVGEGDVSVGPDQCLRCKWSCSSPGTSWHDTGNWAAGFCSWGSQEEYCMKYDCTRVAPSPPPPQPSPPPIPLGECRMQRDYGVPDSNIFHIVQGTCNDFPKEFVERYLGSSCADLSCDGSALQVQLVRTFCPAKCNGCSSSCLDKPALLQALHQSQPDVWPSSCTADWPSAFPGSGFCGSVYRMACSATAQPPFCTAPECVSHSDCDGTRYCDTYLDCYPCLDSDGRTCNYWDDAVDGACPDRCATSSQSPSPSPQKTPPPPPAPPPSPSPPKIDQVNPDSDGVNIGPIVGGAVGGLAAILAFIAVLVCILKKKHVGSGADVPDPKVSVGVEVHTAAPAPCPKGDGSGRTEVAFGV